MRHRVYGKHLGRDKNQRVALFKNLIESLISFGTINTTEAKAKSIKGLVDKTITTAKAENSQKLVSSFLTKKVIREKLIKEIIPGLGSRTSGFTTIKRLGRRLGDGAMMVKMSLLLDQANPETKKTRKEAQVKSQKSKVKSTSKK